LNCPRITPMLDAYVDGELSVSEQQSVAGHLADCASCAQQVNDLEILQSAMASEAIYYHAPGTLRSRVKTVLAAGPAGSLFMQPVTTKSLAAVIVSIALLAVAVGVGWNWWQNQPVPSLAELSVRSQIKAIVDQRQTEVTSSDPRIVKRWIEGKTIQTVTIWDLSAHKYTLAGARMEQTTTGTVPVLVYANGLERVHLYLWPDHCGQSDATCNQCLQGYHLASWNEAGTNCIAVSDLPIERLEEFAKLIQSKGTAGK
jgi:anti-sigma factor RsiW